MFKNYYSKKLYIHIILMYFVSCFKLNSFLHKLSAFLKVLQIRICIKFLYLFFKDAIKFFRLFLEDNMRVFWLDWFENILYALFLKYQNRLFIRNLSLIRKTTIFFNVKWKKIWWYTSTFFVVFSCLIGMDQRSLNCDIFDIESLWYE